MHDVTDLWFDPIGERYFAGANDGALPPAGVVTLRRLAHSASEEARAVLVDADIDGLTTVSNDDATTALNAYFDTLEQQSGEGFMALFPDEAAVEGLNVNLLPEEPEAMLETVGAWLLDPARVGAALTQLKTLTLRLANGLELVAGAEDEALQARISGVRDLSKTLGEMSHELGRRRIFGDDRKIKALVKQLEAAVPVLTQEREQRRAYRVFRAHLKDMPNCLRDVDPATIFP